MLLIISSVFPPEPLVSANLAHDLASALSENYLVTVINPMSSRPLGFSFTENTGEKRKFGHTVLKSLTYPKSKIIGRMRESYSFGKHAAKFIHKNHNTIQGIYFNAWPLLAQFLIVKTAGKYSIPIVLHVQDIYPESLLEKLPVFKKLLIRLLLPIDKYVLHHVHQVITISPSMKSYLVNTRNLEDQKVKVIFNWQNDELFLNYSKSVKKNRDTSCFTFMFVGSLSRTAAIHVIITAFINSGLKNSRLVIAGNGSQKEMLVSLADNSRGLLIEFWDAPMLKIPEIQDKADVLVLSMQKGAAKYALPSKLVAYMFAEKPVLACVDKESDTAQAILQANCGWVVTPEDTAELGNSMRYATTLPKEDLFTYGNNGLKYARDNFSRNKNLKKMVNIISESLTLSSDSRLH